MSQIEPKIKSQYSKFFQANDWRVFKQLAEYYLDVAVHLKKKDISEAYALKLWIRNVQKRLFIGLACELLLKAHYLKQGYGINKPKGKTKWHLYQIATVNPADYKEDDTYGLGYLLDQLKNGPSFTELQKIEQGFRIAKVFRNKEGHVAVYWHDFDDQNFTDIENSIQYFYKEAFGQQISIQFSFATGEKGILQLK